MVAYKELSKKEGFIITAYKISKGEKIMKRGDVLDIGCIAAIEDIARLLDFSIRLYKTFEFGMNQIIYAERRMRGLNK